MSLPGLPYDRHWMVVRADDGKFITQRQIPKLCLVSTDLPPEALLGADWGKLQPGAALVLSAPGMPQLQVPLADPSGAVQPEQLKTVTVWEWTGTAVDEGEAAAAWFSQFLETPCRLVRHVGGGSVPNAVRPTDPEFAPTHEVKFVDGYPILVALEENLADLNARLASSGSNPQALPMQRFRPNIVLAGAGSPWCDDGWKRIAVGPAGVQQTDNGTGAVLDYVKPCDRCKVTTIDPNTAEVGREPLVELGKFRSGKVLGWAADRKSWTHSVFFAWNAVVQQQGQISVGDAVAVVKTAAA
eukprot:gene9814-9972_t